MSCRSLLWLIVALIAFNTGVMSGQLQVTAVLMALIGFEAERSVELAKRRL